MSEHQTTVLLQGWIDRLREGVESAREPLLDHARERLVSMTRRMLGDFPRVRRWEETDDVLQNASIRLCRALREVKPASVREFLGLAATQLRRELIDLARHHYGPLGAGAHHHSTVERDGGRTQAPRDPADRSPGPESAAFWIDFHEFAATLPGDEREVLDLLWYEALTQPEAARVLGVSERTLARRWQAVRLKLAKRLGHAAPG